MVGGQTVLKISVTSLECSRLSYHREADFLPFKFLLLKPRAWSGEEGILSAEGTEKVCPEPQPLRSPGRRSSPGQEEGTFEASAGMVAPLAQLKTPHLPSWLLRKGQLHPWAGQWADSPVAGVGSLWSRQSRSRGACEQGGRAALPLLRVLARTAEAATLVDPQDFPGNVGDSGRQWTTGGPDLPWPPEGDELEMTQKALESRVQGTLPSHPKPLPRGALGLQAMVFAQSSQDWVRLCFEAQYGCGQRSPVFHTCPKRDAADLGMQNSSVYSNLN